MLIGLLRRSPYQFYEVIICPYGFYNLFLRPVVIKILIAALTINSGHSCFLDPAFLLVRCYASRLKTKTISRKVTSSVSIMHDSRVQDTKQGLRASKQSSTLSLVIKSSTGSL